MPCPHNEITIVQRSQRQSAVAAAAYQSGEKLFCEYDQQVKHYPEKRGIVHNEILLPANAPQEYADRNTLWNAAEAVEKQWNSQLARRWVLTIPREIPPDQYAVLVREFCQQQFVSKGMIADFAIHDPHPPGHNPHAHVMLTMRAMDEHGKWLPKSRKVYDLDENGERIKLPSGRWKSHKEDTVDWNDQKYCEIWRHEWEVIQNRYLEANDRPERVDLRSYARQGLDIVPTVHEGAAVRQMEKRGIQTNIGNLNREIRAANSLMKSIRQLIQNLKGWITELGEKRKELLAQKAAEEATLLPNLLMKYMGWERKKPPYNWHRTSGFPMRTGNRRERQKSPSPGRNPRRNSFRKQRAAASVFLPTISTCSGHGERNMPRTPRRNPFIPGLWKPYRSKTKWNICWMCCSLGKRRKKRL